MLALHSLRLSKSLLSSHVFSELIAPMTNVQVSALEFALASLAWLSLVRLAAVSKPVNHSSNFTELYSLKMAMSCSSEFVRFVCFCVVHSVSVYWSITSEKVLKVLGLKSVVPSAQERDFVVPVLCGTIPLPVYLLLPLLNVISCWFLL